MVGTVFRSTGSWYEVRTDDGDAVLRRLRTDLAPHLGAFTAGVRAGDARGERGGDDVRRVRARNVSKRRRRGVVRAVPRRHVPRH